jgi:hypothetical protein
MPPANSPVSAVAGYNREAEHRIHTDIAPGLQDSEQPQSLISTLRELESPILNEDIFNLAATLGTPTEQLDEPRTRLDYLRREQEQEHDHWRLDRSRRVMSYGDRVPSQNTLYDWSPANGADNEDELDQILAELRREQPNTHPEILRVLGRSQLDSERERIRSISTRLNHERSGAGESLRSTAILQSVRRHPRFSARTRDYLQRHNTDRDSTSRPSPHSESPARHISESARQMAMQRQSESRTALDRERRDMLSRTDSYRRGYLDHRTSTSTSTSTPTISPMLEQTVKYLSRIRHSDSIDDSLKHAMDAGFLAKEHSIQYADFMTDPWTVPPPPQTSWLAPGAVLSGCQHATSVAATFTSAASGTTSSAHQFRTFDGSSAPPLPSLPPPTRPWLANSYSTPRSRTSQPASEATASQTPQQDRWPVKVTIHAVDWSAMTLSATMEAYNVPSHPHSHQSLLSRQSPSTHYTRTSSITTYLEGEILDFNTHTLLTESFQSTAANDATYWRKLPPFRDMRDDEVVRKLTSRRWVGEVLSKGWVLMRWKERCFVKSLNPNNSVAIEPPPVSTTTSSFLQDGPAHSYHSHLQSSSATHQSSSATHTPYRLVRDPDTNELQVEITHEDTGQQHASFDDTGCGLTISGFYYVCLNRGTGEVEGLYCDPMSSPYQCLKLESKKGGAVGAWSFC